jgi:hypothetical protein
MEGLFFFAKNTYVCYTLFCENGLLMAVKMDVKGKNKRLQGYPETLRWCEKSDLNGHPYGLVPETSALPIGFILKTLDTTY